MARSGTHDVLSTPDRRAVRAFLAAHRPTGCARLGSESLAGDDVVAAAAATDAQLVGYAQARRTGDDGYTVDSVADDPAVREQLVGTLIDDLPDGVDIIWWAHDNPNDAAVAASLDMHPPFRRLLNMSRPLPIDPVATGTDLVVDVRPFRVGHDEEAWLAVNNAAFSWHGEQGGWDLATLRARMSEPWFDADGFLLHERDGELAAFCWTKVHRSETNPVELTGEIYVVAVHPDFHGLGLGRALTLAGLRHLARTGSTRAMLYVEADNAPAVRLYESLGFHTTHTDVAFHRPAVAESRTPQDLH